jgi:hypothetical protein
MNLHKSAREGPTWVADAGGERGQEMKCVRDVRLVMGWNNMTNRKQKSFTQQSAFMAMQTHSLNRQWSQLWRKSPNKQRHARVPFILDYKTSIWIHHCPTIHLFQLTNYQQQAIQTKPAWKQKRQERRRQLNDRHKRGETCNLCQFEEDNKKPNRDITFVPID